MASYDAASNICQALIWGADGLRLAALYDIPNAIIVFGVSAAIFAAEQRWGLAYIARHGIGCHLTQ